MILNRRVNGTLGRAFPLLAVAMTVATVPEARAQAQGSPCGDIPPAAVIIVDDAINVPAWQAESLRAFRLPSLAQVGRLAAARDHCLRVLDPDPFFAATRGPEPELLLRARVADARSADRSLADKADAAVRRYVEGYLGGGEARVAVLEAAEVAIEAICVRERRFLAAFSGKARRESQDQENGVLVGDAFEAARKDLVKELPRLRAECRKSRD